MILRLAAATALLAGVAGLLGYLCMIGKGPLAPPAARHLRAMKDRTGAPERVTPIGFEQMCALPHHAPAAEVAAIERRGVSIEGYVEGMLRPSDDDIHLEISPVLRGPDQPNGAYVSAEISSASRRGSNAWTYSGLARALRIRSGAATAWERGPRLARISGWLLHDYPYDVVPSDDAVRYAPVRMTGWEIHPVSRIELWDDSLARFVEFAR